MSSRRRPGRVPRRLIGALASLLPGACWSHVEARVGYVQRCERIDHSGRSEEGYEFWMLAERDLRELINVQFRVFVDTEYDDVRGWAWVSLFGAEWPDVVDGADSDPDGWRQSPAIHRPRPDGLFEYRVFVSDATLSALAPGRVVKGRLMFPQKPFGGHRSEIFWLFPERPDAEAAAR